MEEDIRKVLEMLEYASEHEEFKLTLDSKVCELLYNYIEELKNKYEETEIIKDVDNFIWKLKCDNLYTDEMAKFIEDYLKFYNN